jgi:hypothetical protein
MAITLTAATQVHARRVRLVFDLAVTSAAFLPANLAFYGATCLNSAGASPGIVAAMAVLSSPQVVELQLSVDLAPGGTYEFTAVGVPGADASTTPPGSAAALAVPGDRPKLLPPVGGIADTDAWVYGVDLAAEDGDFALAASGDLAVISGPPLVRRDLTMMLMSDGVAWDPSYGLKPREYVDGAAGSLLTIRGKAIAQVLLDDRVAEADATVVPVDSAGDAYVEVRPVLIGDATLSSIEPIRQSFHT